MMNNYGGGEIGQSIANIFILFYRQNIHISQEKQPRKPLEESWATLVCYRN